jgi:hypothetical protein
MNMAGSWWTIKLETSFFVRPTNTALRTIKNVNQGNLGRIKPT